MCITFQMPLVNVKRIDSQSRDILLFHRDKFIYQISYKYQRKRDMNHNFLIHLSFIHFTWSDTITFLNFLDCEIVLVMFCW